MRFVLDNANLWIRDLRRLIPGLFEKDFLHGY